MIKKKKHRCNQFPNRDDDINATIVQGLDPNITVKEAHAILKSQRKKTEVYFIRQEVSLASNPALACCIESKCGVHYLPSRQAFVG